MKKSRWKVNIQSDNQNETQPDIHKVQQYLERFGYLPKTYSRGRLDPQTSEAITRFQRRHSLVVTGNMDEQTTLLMEKPRCGVTESSLTVRLLALESWHMRRNFTFRFLNDTRDINANDERIAITNAFTTWSNATGLTFREVTGATADFEIAWRTNRHGDAGHQAFDGAGNVIAHAYYPRPTGGRDSGQMHFDDDETWCLTGGTDTDLEACALHEIGHLLGLTHSSDTNAVMYEFHSNGRIALTNNDLERIRRLYPNGRLWHSIRQGNPWSQFADIEGAAGERGQFVNIGCATMGSQLHVCAINDDGQLWHSIRQGNPWSQFADVEGAAGERGQFVNVSCSAMGDQLHVCAVTDDGHLWHSIRQGNPWSQFANVEGTAGERGQFVNVSCAAMGNQLHVCAITDDGRLWHSIRQGDPWSQFADVEGAAGERGQFVNVSCAVMGNQLHVCAVTDDGRVWHSIRQGDPWSQFADVEGAAGERGDFSRISCAVMGSQLHVCGVTSL